MVGLTDGFDTLFAPPLQAYVYVPKPPEAVGLPPIVTLLPEQMFSIAGPALTVGIELTVIVLLAVAVQLNVSVTVTS